MNRPAIPLAPNAPRERRIHDAGRPSISPDTDRADVREPALSR
jgi:hypothetical protein